MCVTLLCHLLLTDTSFLVKNRILITLSRKSQAMNVHRLLNRSNWYYLMSSSSYKLKPIVKGFWIICLSLNFLQYCCSCAKMRIQLFILLIAVGLLFTSSEAACLPDGGQCREKVRPQIFTNKSKSSPTFDNYRWLSPPWDCAVPASPALRIL